MKIDVLTLFPEMLSPMLSGSILGRAISAGLLSVGLHNIRDYTTHKHRCTDDYPFGGGAGMVMFAQPIVNAVQTLDPDHRARRVYLSPRGRTLNQRIVEELAKEESLLLLCGHYEGVDQRALDMCIDEELSIGDYVLTGGELGALVVIDSVSRMIPGVLGSAESGEDESFTTGLLEYPQYTRPASFRGQDVPTVLLSGVHADIQSWRREQSLILTRQRRPDLLKTAPLDDHDRSILSRLDAADAAMDPLRAMGLSCHPMGLAEADAFPKRWFAAFVPEENRKAAKKQCFSGRRHVGWLWQAFSMGYAPCSEGETALNGLKDVMGKPCLCYLPDENILLTLDSLTAIPSFPHFILTDEDLHWTFVQPHKPGFGPYFAQKTTLSN